MPRERTGYARFERGRWNAIVWTAEGKRKRIKLDWLNPDPDDKAAEEAARAEARKMSQWAATPSAPARGKDRENEDGRPPPVGDYPERALDGRETFAGYAARWMADRRGRRALASADDDESRLRFHVLPLVGRLAFLAVGRAECEALVRDLDRKVSGAIAPGERRMAWKTAANVWALVTQLFDDATASKAPGLRVREDDPTEKVRPPDGGGRKMKVYLLPREADALLRCADVPLRYRRLYAVAAYTGLRRGELAALRAPDVNLAAGYLVVHKAERRRRGGVKAPKTLAGVRRVPLEPPLAPLLKAFAARAGAGPLLDLPPEQKLADKLREHCRRAGVDRAELFARDAERKRLGFHDLRGTCATWQALRGDDALKIQRRLGHESLETTQGYIVEAEALGPDVGAPFGPLPPDLWELWPVDEGER